MQLERIYATDEAAKKLKMKEADLKRMLNEGRVAGIRPIGRTGVLYALTAADIAQVRKVLKSGSKAAPAKPRAPKATARKRP